MLSTIGLKPRAPVSRYFGNPGLPSVWRSDIRDHYIDMVPKRVPLVVIRGEGTGEGVQQKSQYCGWQLPTLLVQHWGVWGPSPVGHWSYQSTGGKEGFHAKVMKGLAPGQSYRWNNTGLILVSIPLFLVIHFPNESGVLSSSGGVIKIPTLDLIY